MYRLRLITAPSTVEKCKHWFTVVYCNIFGLTQNVKDATHISKKGGPSILDLVLTPPQMEIRTLVVNPGVFGGDFDHFAVEFSIEMNFKTEEKLKLVVNQRRNHGTK